jgi:hypothetical protein
LPAFLDKFVNKKPKVAGLTLEAAQAFEGMSAACLPAAQWSVADVSCLLPLLLFNRLLLTAGT